MLLEVSLCWCFGSVLCLDFGYEGAFFFFGFCVSYVFLLSFFIRTTARVMNWSLLIETSVAYVAYYAILPGFVTYRCNVFVCFRVF